MFLLAGSFEITFNDMILFSKLESGGFPETQKVTSVLKVDHAITTLGSLEIISCVLFWTGSQYNLLTV